MLFLVIVVMAMPLLMTVVMAMFLIMVMVMSFFPAMMVMPAAAQPVLIIMMFMFPGMFQHLFHHVLQIVHSLDGLQNRPALQFLPGRGDNGSPGIVLPDQFHCRLQLLLGHMTGSAENDGACMFDLVHEKLPEILYIHLALGGIHHGHSAVHFHFQISGHILHRFHHIGKFAHPGRLNQHSLRLVSSQYFLQGGPKVSHQRTADTPGIHLLDLDTRIL